MDIQEIKKMPVAKRILMAQEIWDSIDGDSIELSDPIKRELDSRLERLQKGQGKNYSLGEAKKVWAKKRK